MTHSIRTAVTVSLVEQAKGGPFVLWDGVEAGCQTASELGFDAIELFAPGPDAVDPAFLKGLLDQHGLQLAAVGTGAGMVRHGLSLTDPREEQRVKARAFVQSMIEYGAPFGAPAIIGSMQGRWGGEVSREQGFDWLREALNELGQVAGEKGVVLIYEPLNRYETNYCMTQASGVELLQSLSTSHVRLLADVFHMNIEESDLAGALRQSAGHVGHVHLVDSNRRAAGWGHLDLPAVVTALKETGYQGYLSAECFPLPDSLSAARQTIETYRRLLA